MLYEVITKNSKVLPVKPGKPIRFPVEEKGRFKPVNVTEWLDKYTIPVETRITSYNVCYTKLLRIW